MTVTDLTSHLTLDEHGIWRGPKTEEVFYPDTGNAECLGLEDDSFWFRHRNACIVALVRRFQPDGAIVDVGGGNGFVTRALIDAGFESILLEPGATGALNAKTHREIPDVICSTIQSARFQPSSVGAVGLFDVLEHLQDDHGMVADLAHLLKTNGLFFGTVPAYQWLWSTADEFAQHHRRYSRKSLFGLLGRDYDILFSTYIFQALTLPIYLVRALPFRLGLTKKDGLMSAEAEHGTDRGLAAGIISRVLAGELTRVELGLSQSWGASLLFVARKKS